MKTVDRLTALREIKGSVITVKCNRCNIDGALDRKAIVGRLKASVTLGQLRRRAVGACARMCIDGIDRCEAVLTPL